MKKVLNILFVIFLLSGTLLFAANEVKVERSISDRDESPYLSGSTAGTSREMWDLQFNFDVTAASGAAGNAGCEFDGTYFYTTRWASNLIYKYDINGALIEEFSIPGVTGLRDLAYDGNHFYGGASGSVIYEMDFETQTLIGSINSSVAVRAIAYNEDLDAFFVSNFADPIGLIGHDGTTIATFDSGLAGTYGFAYDNLTADGPYLWLFDQGAGSGTPQIIHQMDALTYAMTGVTHSVSDELPDPEGIAGGLFVTADFEPGLITIGGLLQGVPDQVFCYELAVAADPAAPAVPTDVTVTPDAGGALTADIDWVCPDLDVGGNTLTDLDEMRVYRDGNLIYTDSAPVIGDPGNYSDVVPASGNYTYSVVGFNDAGEGLPANVVSWVGEDVPNGVTDLMLEDLSTDTDLIAYLSWVNPTTGLHGGPFNEPILGYHVVRSDMVEVELTGVLTEWTDDTITVIDYYSYSITAYNSIGDGATVISNTSLITTANIMFADDFSGGLANWTLVNNGGTADWMISNDPARYTMPATSLPPVCTADSDLAGSGSTMDTELILATALDCSAMIDVILEFDSDFNMIDADDFCYVDISVNGGVDWTNVLTYNGADIPATHEMLNISPVVAGFAEVLIRFHSVQPGWDYWWTIDNVMVSGTEGDLGAIVGTVIDAVTTNPIEGAIVTFSGTTQTTDVAGYYEFATAFPGTYTLTCEADGYYDGAEESIVLSGETTTTDFAMNPFEFATLDGIVTDADTGDPLVGANINAISMAGYEYDEVTDDTGYYVINDIVAETYDVSCSFPDYPTGLEADVLLDPGATVTVDFSLEGYTYLNDFETNNGSLIASDNTWEWGTFTSGPMAGYSGTNGWATSIGGEYPVSSNSTLDIPAPFLVEEANALLEFWHWYDTEASYDGGNVKISPDGGSSWNVIVPLTGYTGVANTSNPLNGEEIFCGHDQGIWELAQFDLSSYVGQSVMFRWHFGSDISLTYPGWYIDDVAISGCEMPDPGWIEGTVVISDGAGNVEDVVVSAGGESVNPLEDGTYSIELQSGTYDVTATLAGYDTEVIEGIEVEEALATTGIDFTLVTGVGNDIIAATKLNSNYPNPFNPVTKISYSVKEPSNVTMEIYNIRGQLVKSLVNEVKETGNYTISWNGIDNSNKSVSSGVYFYKMKTQNYNSTKKMILMK